MHEYVQLLYNDLQKKIQEQEESGTRDLAAEKQEQMRRQQAANKKAQAVVKFENVMSQMFFRNLAQATIQVFLDVKEPLFDHVDDDGQSLESDRNLGLKNKGSSSRHSSQSQQEKKTPQIRNQNKSDTNRLADMIKKQVSESKQLEKGRFTLQIKKPESMLAKSDNR